MIAIIDYGMGNLHSVYNALKAVDCECVITHDIDTLKAADGLILPGVGAFYDCMQNLEKSGLITTIKEEVKKGKPLLGICLGMQILFEEGFEVQKCNGLGFLKGKIQLMKDSSVKIPHIGWNTLTKTQSDYIMDVYDKQPFVYFVHSYCLNDYDENDLIAYTTYGSINIPAYVRKGNVLGMQYHPEKSGTDGLLMLKAFKEMCQNEYT